MNYTCVSLHNETVKGGGKRIITLLGNISHKKEWEKKERMKMNCGDLCVAEVMWTCRLCTFSRRGSSQFTWLIQQGLTDWTTVLPPTSVLSCVLIGT